MRVASSYELWLKSLEIEEVKLKSSLRHQVRFSASGALTSGERVHFGWVGRCVWGTPAMGPRS